VRRSVKRSTRATNKKTHTHASQLQLTWRLLLAVCRALFGLLGRRTTLSLFSTFRTSRFCALGALGRHVVSKEPLGNGCNRASQPRQVRKKKWVEMGACLCLVCSLAPPWPPDEYEALLFVGENARNAALLRFYQHSPRRFSIKTRAGEGGGEGRSCPTVGLTTAILAWITMNH
jgi:hypothetical protein